MPVRRRRHTRGGILPIIPAMAAIAAASKLLTPPHQGRGLHLAPYGRGMHITPYGRGVNGGILPLAPLAMAAALRYLK